MALLTDNDQVTLPVSGMTCAACVVHVSNALSRIEGVDDANVNLATERATVNVRHPVPLRDLAYALEEDRKSVV